MDNIRALVIIPAKMDSTRVKNKNLRIIAGQTLLEHSLDYAMKSKYTIDIIVTSESIKVADLVHGYRHNNILDVYTHMVHIDKKELHIVKRDKEYMGEREVADVYVNVIQNDIYNPDQHSGIKENGSILREDLKNVTHIVGVQPDHPDRKVDLDTLLKNSNIISCHVPLTDETKKMINKACFNQMNDVYFINASRGEVIDDLSLIDALKNGNIRCAALDVLSGEANGSIDSHILVDYARIYDNLIITPHCAGSSNDGLEKIFKHAAKTLVNNLGD